MNNDGPTSPDAGNHQRLPRRARLRQHLFRGTFRVKSMPSAGKMVLANQR